MRTGERKEERGEPAFTAHLPFGSKCLTPVLKVIHFCSPRNNCFLPFPTAELIVKVEFNCPHHPRQDVLYPTLCDSEKSSYVATCIWCKESTSGFWCVPMLWGILCGQLPPPNSEIYSCVGSALGRPACSEDNSLLLHQAAFLGNFLSLESQSMHGKQRRDFWHIASMLTTGYYSHVLCSLT